MHFSFEKFVDNIDMIDFFDDRPVRQLKVYKSRFNPMVQLEEKEFHQEYRFSKANMEKVINVVRSDISGDKRGGFIPVELQVMAAIRYWGRNEIQDDGADIHGFSQPSLSRICERVALAFASKSRTYIKMPVLRSEQIKVISGFRAISGFPNVIGAIDCTHIKIKKVSGPSGEYYVNSKGFYSINTQVVCDSSLKIMDIDCRWSGSTNDSLIFKESRIKKRFDNGEFKGQLLGDGNYDYAFANIIFTPVLNPVTDAELKYNIAHIATRHTIEKCFEVWKQRFRILLSGMRTSLKKVEATVVALAVLHNLSIDFQDRLIDADDLIDVLPAENMSQQKANQNLARKKFIEQHFEFN